MAAKKAAALESVDSDAPPPINTLTLAVAAARKAALKPQRRDLQLLRDASNVVRRFQTSSFIELEQALADASRSVDDTRAGTDEALDKADELQDSCAAVRDALLLNEEPPARLPATLENYKSNGRLAGELCHLHPLFFSALRRPLIFSPSPLPSPPNSRRRKLQNTSLRGYLQ